MEEFSYIKRTYGVYPYIGQKVVMDGKPGIIAEDRGNYVGVIFDDNPNIIASCHPTWNIKYIT